MLNIENLSAEVVASFLGRGWGTEEQTKDGRWVVARPQFVPLRTRIRDAFAVLKGKRVFAVEWPEK